MKCKKKTIKCNKKIKNRKQFKCETECKNNIPNR